MIDEDVQQDDEQLKAQASPEDTLCEDIRVQIEAEHLILNHTRSFLLNRCRFGLEVEI